MSVNSFGCSQNQAVQASYLYPWKIDMILLE